MSYEDLVMEDNFSEDEVPVSVAIKSLKDKKDKQALKKLANLEKQIGNLKNFTVDSMQLILKTLRSIDENSKKIVYKHFDHKHVNHLERQMDSLQAKHMRIVYPPADNTSKRSESLDSVSSGNTSINDEVNNIQIMKKKIDDEQSYKYSPSFPKETEFNQSVIEKIRTHMGSSENDQYAAFVTAQDNTRSEKRSKFPLLGDHRPESIASIESDHTKDMHPEVDYIGGELSLDKDSQGGDNTRKALSEKQVNKGARRAKIYDNI